MKHFTKLTTLLFTILLVLGLAGCGTTAPEATTEAPEEKITSIEQLFTDKYLCLSSSVDETYKTWKAVYAKADNYGKEYTITIPFTKEEYEAFQAISFADEDYETKSQEILKSADDITIVDVSDRVPTQAELDELYVGKTLGDLEDAGFMNSGDINDEEGHYRFFYDGTDYSLLVSPTEVIEDIDDYSTNDIRALEIASVTFTGFTETIFEK